MADSDLSACIPALVDAAEREPDVRRFLHDYNVRRRRALTAAIAAGCASGDLAPDLDPELAATALVTTCREDRKISVALGGRIAPECSRLRQGVSMRRYGRHPLARVWMPMLVVLVAVACSNGAEQADDRDPTPGAVTASAPAEATTESSAAPTTVTPEEYQQALTALDERLAGAFGEVAKLRSPVGLPEAVAALRNQVDEERAALAQVVPPESVADAHAELDVALSDLSADLSALEGDASASVVCAGGAAVRRAGNSDGAAAVREAAARLLESDPVEEYSVGAFVPEGGKERNRRGRNGDLRPGRRNGPNVLKITGSPSQDALLKLRIKKRGIRNVYVRAGSNVEVNDLPDGNYDVFVAQGADWSGKTARFTRECSFSRLDDRLEFRSTATQYSIWELELTETILGNAPSSPMDPKDFPN